MDLKKIAAVYIPILAFVGVLGAWVDVRFMHREMSDLRHVDTQLALIKSGMREYEIKLDNGEVLSAKETREYGLKQTSVDWLNAERRRLLGLAE